MLGAEKGSSIFIEADGVDAQLAIDELTKIIVSKEDL